ncbi:hypothetical protein DACRYDRAFT_23741 [Dacryopinax primogenitus]|uniref:Uncharacterized protein n=1 Tax=Dacryopinax primogenitus (strain DJM 731) TaxID=1858805 RepID=M5FVS4_DACPD|nr:uncharacterized protein DACRYDRAFT_23741 [Dacryopinax primogenitus]EJT99689.1 hypothetical protein DACRYDRAFT_23741 [Dacryopinax primogenitus]
MLRTSLSRTAFRPARNPHILPRRFNSTQPRQGSAFVSNFLSAILGGGVVLGGIYGYYHWSGAAKFVQGAQKFRDSAVQARDKALKNVPSTSQAIAYLRQTAHAYTLLIPGGKKYVDETFDNLEEASRKHGPEVDGIIGRAYAELRKVVDEGEADLETARKVAGVLARRGKELAELTRKAGGDFLDKYPGAEEGLGKAYAEMERFAFQRGEEGKKAMEDVRKQLGEMLSKGGASTDEVVSKAKEMLSRRQQDLRGVGEKVWKEGMDRAKPYLDKLPELRKTLDEHRGTFVGAVSGKSGEVWDRLRQAAEGKDKKKTVQEFKDWVNEKEEEATEAGEETWDKLEETIKLLPGGQVALESTPELQKYTDALKQKAPEAKKVAEEAWSEILAVLKEKGKKIKQLGKEGKEEVKK